MSYLQITSVILAVAAACVTPFYLIKFLTESPWNSRWRRRKQRTVGPKSWPILGTAVEHMRNYHRMHDWLLSYFENGSTISAPMPGGQINYYTVDTENVKYMLKTNFNNFPKGEAYHERMEVLLGNGIFNADGEKWRQQRKTASMEFSMRSLRDFNAVVFKDVALKLSSLLRQIEQQGVSIDMQDLFMRMTLDSIGKIGFGADFGVLPWRPPLPDNDFAKAFDISNDIVTRRFIDPLWRIKRLMKFGGEGQLEKNIKVLDSITYAIIAQRKLDISTARKACRSQASGAPCQAPKLDMMTRFLELTSEDDDNHAECKILRDIVVNFVIAGRDTTAVTLSWFLFSLTEHSEVACRLYEELRNFEIKKRVKLCRSTGDESGLLTTRDDGDIDGKIREFSELLTYESLKAEELPYLQAAISETLRLFPAVPLDPKAILEDTVLPDGTTLKKGNMISYSPYCMARVPYIWGPDAPEFRPDRWLQDGKFFPVSEYKFATFQAGLRTCLGKDSAYLQMKITAAILCRFFIFEREKGHDVNYKMMAILSMASGLRVNVRVRRE